MRAMAAAQFRLSRPRPGQARHARALGRLRHIRGKIAIPRHTPDIIRRYYFGQRCAKTTFWLNTARIQFVPFVFCFAAYGKMDEKLIACFAIGNRRDLRAYDRMRPM
jgi:hypothetical protein